MKYNNNPQGFTLLLILGIVGFLLILLTGIYKVVLFELEDTRDMSHFMKSRTAAESGGELAMLRLKENGFGYDADELYDSTDITGESIMLSDIPLDAGEFNKNGDVFFGYEIDSKASTYTGAIEPGDFKIIPLFYIEDGGVVFPTTQPTFTVEDGIDDDLVWNIIGTEGGISGKGAFDPGNGASLKTLNEIGDTTGGSGSNKGFGIENVTIENFLGRGEKNYLTIYNVGDSNIEYKIDTGTSGEFFTKPVTKVYSSAKIGDIKQNIELEIENSKYFDVLKYSIYDY